MKTCKLLLAVLGAGVLLGALVSSASAGRLSTSGQVVNASWTRMNFSGGFGTVECEVILNGTYHSRTIAKTAGSLIGFLTAANVNRCARGSATILREMLPWHYQYSSFAGTLPNITAQRISGIGVAFRIREPTFGQICLAVATASESMGITTNISGGVIQSQTVSGTIRCGEFTVGLSGNSSSITRVTITLI